MSAPAHNPRRNAFRALTWTGLLAVPVLAVAAAGPALCTTAGHEAAVVADGLSVPAGARVQAAGSGDEVRDVWQNTGGRPVYIPPTRSPYIPPTP